MAQASSGGSSHAAMPSNRRSGAWAPVTLITVVTRVTKPQPSVRRKRAWPDGAGEEGGRDMVIGRRRGPVAVAGGKKRFGSMA
ncbi:hypothetical protein GCM10007860_20470 [Chitiniphilus shinanonensis]|uniref:Uncharacterized protein n=1 Tax=Chitiniphilus shinanonensis TaxID=553088 RepID=A0ABQ6BYX3_9NEIS|nr:hypothetical protein GCM10007860_20470 [Chitiniphilus shinanonensis]